MEDKEIKTKEEARQYVIDYQSWASNQSLSMGELADYGNRFYRLGRKFGLTKEFKENGII